MGEQACRGIRGAITVPDDDPASVGEAVGELLDGIAAANGCRAEEVASVLFTLTDDLPSASPAAHARAHGWQDVPMLVVREHGGATEVPRCIRVLVLWNTDRAQRDIRHVYLREAARLRPDLLRTDGGPGGSSQAASLPWSKRLAEGEALRRSEATRDLGGTR